MPWSVADYNTNPALNSTINGTDIAENSAAAGYNNALRQLMADIKTWTVTYAITFPISIANGGTGQTTAAAAIVALGGLPLTGGIITGNLAINGNLFNSSNGVYPYWDNAGMSVGAMFIQALGADPTLNPGDMVFEY